MQNRINLTHNQMLMWLGQQRHPTVPLYNMIETCRIHGALDVERFQQAFQLLVTHTDTLRLVIDEVDGVPYQRVREGIPRALEILHMDESAYDDWLSGRRREMFTFDDALYDSVLIQLGDEDFIWYLCQHHIVTDGWSFKVTYDRLRQFYDTLESADTLPQYRDYVAQEQAHRQTDAFQRAQAYWQAVIDEPQAALAFYGTSVKNRGTRTKRISCTPGSERINRLQKALDTHTIRSLSDDVTQFAAFMALYAAFVHRISGKENFRVGVPFHNRVNRTQQQTPGLFIEMGVLPIEITPETSFVDLTKAIIAQTFRAMQHVQPGISQAQMNHAYDVVFNYLNVQYDSFAGHPVTINWHISGESDSIHSLRAQVHDLSTTGQQTIEFDFNCDVFDAAQREQVVQHFLNLMDSILAEPALPIATRKYLSADEYQLMVHDWNDTATDYGQLPPVHHLFEAQTARLPEHIALASADTQMSYNTLNRRANQLAHYLMSLGVQPETLVAVSIERHPDLIVSLLAVLKAGAAFVPVDPGYPPERVAYMLDDTATPVLLTQSHLLPETHSAGQVVQVDTLSDTLSQFADDNPAVDVSLDNLAYVIYTSGSTGHPKGVMIPHRNFSNHLHYLRDTLDMQPEHGMLQKSPFSFDAGIFEIFSSIMWGATLYLADADVPQNVDKMYQAFVQFPVTHTVLVPTQIQLLLRDYDFAACDSLQRIVSGGEPLPPTVLHDTLETLPHVTVHNLYGPAECTIDATHWATRTPADPVLIGTPVTNTRVYVLDENLQLVPPGVPAELFIGGIQLARGYLNRPDLTRKKFIQHPEFGRLYRTGDLVRWTPDGQIEMLGRTDFQVKIRGARVEPGEVENQLLTHDRVQEAVVIAQSGDDNHTMLVAYLVGDADISDLRQYARQRLPAHMVPSVFVPVDAIPLTPNGKTSRTALTEIDLTPYMLNSTYIAPESDLEHTLVSIWQDVLNHERIGIQDDFFALGGHSLPAVRILSRIQATYDVRIAIDMIFDNPTIQLLSAAIEAQMLADIENLSDEDVLRLLEDEPDE